MPNHPKRRVADKDDMNQQLLLLHPTIKGKNHKMSVQRIDIFVKIRYSNFRL